MFNRKRKSGFTLTEVLISAGILSIGFMLIAGAFPVGIKLTSMATERTIGSLAAQEAIAKIKLHGLDDTPANLIANSLLFSDRCVDYETVAGPDFIPTPNTPMDDPWDFSLQFSQFYPSTIATDIDELNEKKYHWSALCRYLETGTDTVQVTIFVSRLASPGVKYPDPVDLASTIEVPKPAKVTVALLPTANILDVSSASAAISYFREGSVIVDNSDGNLYTVQEIDSVNNTVLLDRAVVNTVGLYDFWVIPSAIKPGTSDLGGRWPCVWVFQDTIRF